MMPEFLQFDFMQRALLAGILIAILAPVIGVFLVLRRYSLMADTLAHVSLSGVAFGLLLSVYPVLTALIATILAAIAIESLRAGGKVYGESALAVFLPGGLALASVILSVAGGFNRDLLSYLFGSILVVQTQDLWLMGGLGFLTILSVGLFYKELFYVSFDEESAMISGIPVRKINILLVVLTATTVALAMRIVGVLLISALMVIPVISAMQITKSFRGTLYMAIVFSLLSVLIGLLAAFYLNLAAGGAIVLTTILFFLGTLITGRGKH